MFCSPDIAKFVAVGIAAFVACKTLSRCHAETASSLRQDQNVISSQYLRPDASSEMPAASPEANGNPRARLRNDGRPFELHVAPNRDSAGTARLYPLTRFVELLGRCTRQWCYVRAGSAVGWLSTDRFLKDPSDSPAFLSWLIKPARRPETIRPAILPQTMETALLPKTIGTDKNADDHAQVAIALPVRRGPALPLRRPSLPDISTVPTTAAIQPKISHIEPKNYALKELGSKIFLPIQENRTETSRVLGTIPFFVRDVKAVGECIDDWCLVRRGSLQGWIERRHLTDQPSIAVSRLQLEPVMPVEALNIYSAPNREAKLVAKIEPPVTDIEPLDSCDEQWCYVRHHDTVGWVEPTYLTRQ